MIVLGGLTLAWKAQIFCFIFIYVRYDQWKIVGTILPTAMPTPNEVVTRVIISSHSSPVISDKRAFAKAERSAFDLTECGITFSFIHDRNNFSTSGDVNASIEKSILCTYQSILSSIRPSSTRPDSAIIWMGRFSEYAMADSIWFHGVVYFAFEIARSFSPRRRSMPLAI